MKKKAAIFMVHIFAVITAFSFALPLRAEVNDMDFGLVLRGALGGGNIFWGYISHSNKSGDLGTGSGAVFNLAGMFNYWFAGLEANMLYGNIGELKWSDEDQNGNTHNYKSTGSGHYLAFDLKLGAKLFTEPGDMGYTFFYIGKRWWSTERSEDSVEFDGISIPNTQKREGEGDGWIYGYRDFTTIGPDNSFAIVVQTGFFIGKAPVNKFKQNGVEVTQPNDESITFGGEVAGGVALQNIGFSAVGGLRGEINATSFVDTAAPEDESSIFGFGNFAFFIEAGFQL